MSNDISSTIRIGLIIATLKLPRNFPEMIQAEFDRDPGGPVTQFYNDATVALMASIIAEATSPTHNSEFSDAEVAAFFINEVNDYLTDRGQIAYQFINDVRINYNKYKQELIDLGFDVR